MLENNTEAVNQEVSTPDTQTQQVTDVTAEAPKMYTKDEVIELMKKRVNRSHNSFFKRYGVKDLQELDAKFNGGKELQDNYLGLQNKNAELVREIAFLKNNINPDRYDDIIAYFKGKGIDFSEEQLIALLETHPEWLKQEVVSQVEPKPATTTIKSLGIESHTEPKTSEKELASKLLGVKL